MVQKIKNLSEIANLPFGFVVYYNKKDVLDGRVLKDLESHYTVGVIIPSGLPQNLNNGLEDAFKNTLYSVDIEMVDNAGEKEISFLEKEILEKEFEPNFSKTLMVSDIPKSIEYSLDCNDLKEYLEQVSLNLDDL